MPDHRAADSPSDPPTGRRSRPTRLAVHLTIVLIIKIILLTLLWHAFIKPNKVPVDAVRMETRLTGTLSQPQGDTK